ncbi:LysR family transcriptional regulator [Photorhabdus antumapuensis]|uniref:LysR family transcriptional regulator n=1 Tax=Photorhabdus antumapuensis TaxID=2862867 RepID=UPI001CED29F9|nr:LysR family transcriptional regulator [Photorhabdus antumapuensis]MCA6219322.1 LysR family transcriptional regulator [Photorhabdus antumapuensis]
MNYIDIENIDLNLLRVFEALIEEGGASRAAIRLGLTQPAVSAALGRLRRVYSDPLFERTGRGLRPTVRANELAPLVEEALTQCRQALALTTAGKEIKGRTVTVGLSDDSEIALGQKILKKVDEHLPGLHIIFRQTHSGLAQDMLMRHQIDLAITAGGLSSHLVKSHRLGKGNYLCIADKNTSVPVTVDDYAQRPHLLVSSGGFVGVVDEALNAVGYKRSVKVSTTHFAAVPFLLIETDLITTVPSHAARAMEKSTSLQIFPCPVSMPPYELEIGTRVGSRHDKVLHELKSIIVKICQTPGFLS